MGHFGCSASVRKPNETMRLIVATFVGVVVGFLLGLSFPTLSLTKINLSLDIVPSAENIRIEAADLSTQIKAQTMNVTSKIWVSSNPRGAERLAPGFVVPHSDQTFIFADYTGSPDLAITPKYLVTFTVGYNQRLNIDAVVKKFSENFTILLFHYDNQSRKWDEYEWSKQAIHISAPKQTKWWYAKRFLHPDVVAAYDYIFIWDEDLGVEHFNAEEYLKLVKKHGLEISQPGVEPNRRLTWQMTKRREDLEVHKETEEKPSWCHDPHLPPCAGFVEIMAPVFSRESWRCVWHMIQNDLVHGWGLDFALQKCDEPPHEKIGVVDAQWIVHQSIPSLGGQGHTENGKQPWQGVRERCKLEWKMFQNRVSNGEKTVLQVHGNQSFQFLIILITPPYTIPSLVL